jgi:hypothetical protein
MKLWLDDIRNSPEDYTVVRTVSDAIDMINNRSVTEISFDYDLGLTDNKTGMDLVIWMIDNLPPIKWPHTIKVHSANPVGRKAMILKFYDYAPRFVYIVE